MTLEELLKTATPRPWQVGPTDVIWSKRPECALADVRFPKVDSYNPRTIDEAKANAALIFHAVNNFPAVVRALEALLIEGPKSVKALGDLVDPITYSAALHDAEQALAAAKEVKP